MLNNLYTFDCEVTNHNWLFVFKSFDTAQYVVIHDDYEEIGYIHVDGHLMAYILCDGLYYLVNPVDYAIYNGRWSDKWMVNVTRSRPGDAASSLSTWSPLKFNFHEHQNFNTLGGFPIRPMEDDICIHSAVADLQEETETGYKGVLTVSGTGKVTTAPWQADYASVIKKVVIEEGVTSLCKQAFSGCTSLTELIVGKEVEISDDAMIPPEALKRV